MKLIAKLQSEWLDFKERRRRNRRMETALRWLDKQQSLRYDENFVYVETIKTGTVADLQQTFWKCLQVVADGIELAYYRIDGLVATCTKDYGVWKELCEIGERRLDELDKQICIETDNVKCCEMAKSKSVLEKGLKTLSKTVVTYTVMTWQPGRLIGKGGCTIDALKKMLEERLSMDVRIEISEMKEDGSAINIMKKVSTF